MTAPQHHDYTIPLHPTPAQADTLRRLGHAADHARAMAYDLAALGQLTASTLPELPGMPYVPDHRAIAADVATLRQLVPLRDVPVDVLHAAVAAGQRAFAHGRARTSQDGCITGDALLTPALDGVDGRGAGGSGAASPVGGRGVAARGG